MKNPSACQIFCAFLFFFLSIFHANSQESSKPWMIGIFAGVVNYQGDLQPTSFTLDNAKPAFAITVRKPLGRWLSFKSGLAIGQIQASDKHNRDYLQARNLSFNSGIKELNAGLELNILDISTKNFSPYIYGGVSVFHFNPWTNDETGNKVFLQPLGTEGQGLSAYPDRKPYKLIQPALAIGAGARIVINENFNIGVEFSQRKSFIDYIDDVSTNYADYNLLLNARGTQAVSLAYRGDELPGGRPYPHAGEQRGTPTEMDWYYYFGITLEFKLSHLGSIFRFNGNSSPTYTRCPRLN